MRLYHFIYTSQVNMCMSYTHMILRNLKRRIPGNVTAESFIRLFMEYLSQKNLVKCISFSNKLCEYIIQNTMRLYG